MDVDGCGRGILPDAASVASGEAPTDQVSLRFTKIEMEYTPVKPDGSLGAPIKEGWDLAMNRSA
jgi:type VI protein secretion system component Hcp